MIVDASVALKWLIKEEASSIADELLARDDLAAPSILMAEAGYVLTKRMRQGAFSSAFARAAWKELQEMPVRILPPGPEIDQAFELSTALKANFYDCVYLGLAVVDDDVVVTADESFVRAVRASRHIRLHARVRLLTDVARPLPL